MYICMLGYILSRLANSWATFLTKASGHPDAGGADMYVGT
jgi:hypothetical protein